MMSNYNNKAELDVVLKALLKTDHRNQKLN